MKWMVRMIYGNSITSSIFFCLAAALSAAPLILNEYNAVDKDEIFEEGGRDSHFDAVAGNGGNWFELVVVSDGLDARGWKL